MPRKKDGLKFNETRHGYVGSYPSIEEPEGEESVV